MSITAQLTLDIEILIVCLSDASLVPQAGSLLLTFHILHLGHHLHEAAKACQDIPLVGSIDSSLVLKLHNINQRVNLIEN